MNAEDVPTIVSWVIVFESINYATAVTLPVM